MRIHLSFASRGGGSSAEKVFAKWLFNLDLFWQRFRKARTNSVRLYLCNFSPVARLLGMAPLLVAFSLAANTPALVCVDTSGAPKPKHPGSKVRRIASVACTAQGW
jgi:hypothetical protein